MTDINSQIIDEVKLKNAAGTVINPATNEASQDANNTVVGAALPAYLGTPFIDEDLYKSTFGLAYAGNALPATPADTWLGAWTPISNFAGFSLDAIATGLGHGYAIWSTDGGTTVSRVEMTVFAGAGAFSDPPQGATHYCIAFQNRSATPVTFTLHSQLRYAPQNLFMFPAFAPIDGTFPAALVKGIITGSSRLSGYRDVRVSDTDALSTRDERLTTTQSGSLFTEGITSHISHIFSRDRGIDGVQRMVQVSASGTITHDATEGRAVIATSAVNGEVAYFRTAKTLRYDEAAHMLRFELTGEIPQWPLVGTEEILIGPMEDDGAEGILNGIVHGFDSGGYFVGRIKMGTMVAGTKTYSDAFNRNPLVATDTSNVFRTAGVPQALNPFFNNYFLGYFEWLGVAPPTYGVQIPSGEPTVIHIEETPNNVHGTILQEPNIPIGIRIRNDATSGRILQFHIGSIRGGTHESRVVVQGQKPDGDYVPARATGLGRDRVFDDIEFVDDLAGNEVIQSDWMDTDQYENLDLTISSSVQSVFNGLLIEYTDDTSVLVPRIIRTERATYGAEDAANGSLSRDISTRGDGFRITYANGPVAASPFYLSVTVRTQARAPTNTLKGAISETSTAAMGRTALFAESDTNNDFELIKRGPNNGLRVSVREHESDTPVKTLSDFEVGQITANPTTATTIPPPAFTDVKAISIANLSADTRLFFGKAGVTRTSGDIVFPGSKEHFETDGSQTIHVISDPAAGLTDNHLLDADTVVTNSGTLNPTNLFATDAAYATFNDQGDFVEISGFDATASQTLDEVQSLFLKMRGKKATSPPTQTITHVETQNGAQAGGVTVTSASMAGGTDLLYVVSVSRNALNSISNISGGGLTYSPILVNKANGGRHLDVWYAFGSPTAGAVIASMTSSTNGHISVSSFSGVEPTSPIQDSDFTTGTGTSVGTPTMDVTNLGFALLAVSHEATLATPGALYTERSDQTNGTGANTDSLATFTKPITTTGTETPTATLASSTDWVAIAVSLLPRTVNPVITITNDQGATVATFTITSTTDADFSHDITADVVDYADIDAMVLHAEATTMGDTDATIDRIWLDFTEAQTGASVRFAYKWLGVD